MPDLIRHPVLRKTWIADQVRNDRSGGGNDRSGSGNDRRGINK